MRRRLGDDDFARSSWNLRRFFWAPRLGLVGPSRISVFKDIFIASGTGVGGGSLDSLIRLATASVGSQSVLSSTLTSVNGS